MRLIERIEDETTLKRDLIRLAREGDEPALRELYEAHRGPVMRLAYSLLGDEGEAEDLMQDVLVQALTNLDRYDDKRAAFSTWLHTITVNRCRDRLRRRRLGLERVADFLRGGPAQEIENPERSIDRLDAASTLGRVLGGLTPLQREAIVLREVEGLSYAEMGEVLGVPMRTAQTRVTAAYAALRKALKKPGQALGDQWGSENV